MTRTLIVRSRGRCLFTKVSTPDSGSMRKYVASLKGNGYKVAFKSGQIRGRFWGSLGR